MLRPLFLAAFSLSVVCAQEIIQLDKIEVEEEYTVLEERKDQSIAKRIIKGEELSQYGDLNALEVLKRTPGVTVPEGKGKKGAPGKGYTKVLIDGEEVSSTKRGNPLEQISPEMIERIEVMTNGSAEYTAEAMGGIVNIVLKKPSSEGKTIAKLTGGVYNAQAMGSVFAQREGKAGEYSYLFNATYADNTHKDDASNRIDDTVNMTEKLRDSQGRYRALSLNGKLIYAPDTKNKYAFDASMGLNANSATADERTYTNGALSTTLYNRDESDAMMLWTKLSGEHHLSGTELVDWKLKFHQNDSEGENRSGTKLQYDDSLFRVFGADGSYSRVVGEHFVKTGAEVKRLMQDESIRVLSGGVETSNVHQSLRQDKGSLYLQDEVGIGEDFLVTPGIRYETVSRDFAGSSNIDYFAPSLHLLYRLSPDDNLRASVSKTVRLPRLDELTDTVDSSLELNDLTRPDVRGNPSLKEEKALSYELRLEHYFADKGIISVGGFYREIDDKIEKLTTYEGGRYVERPYNAGEGRLWSVEFELKKSLDAYVGGLGIFANATVQNSSLSVNGFKRPIKATNDYLYNIGLDHTLSAYRLTYGAAYRYVGGYDDPTDENGIAESQKGYGTLDLYAKKRIDSTFRAGINLKNLTGETITTTTRRYASGNLVETQAYRENTRPYILMTLEGRW
ncbi:MAG: TonB-dependent receptor [Sulfuricurvum sp.]|nr:TonB-dependent receptor [Sulfuricurvum sp.]